MNEVQKKDMVECWEKLAKEKEIKKILSGGYERLISIDINNVVKEFNRGNYDILNSEDTIYFLQQMVDPQNILNILFQARTLISYKKRLDGEKSYLQERFSYDPDNIFFRKKRYYGEEDDIYTYKDMYANIELAEQFVESKKTYQLLRYLCKYYDLAFVIKQRRNLFEVCKKNADKTDMLLEIMKNGDKKVGIVRIDDSRSGVSIEAGTQVEMEFSNLMGYPFKQDIDEEGYWYGYGGGDYIEPHKIVKTFHGDGETSSHKKMIEAENRKRLLIGYEADIFEKGYIMNDSYAIIISRFELLRNSINPNRVNWKPLRITYESTRLFNALNVRSVKEAVSLGKKLILK